MTGTAAILAAGLLDAPRSAAWSAPKAVGRRDYILAPGASLTGILTVIPVAFLALGLTATVLHMLMIGFKKGSLVSAEGKLLEGPHEGGTGQGTMDLVNVYFFSCFAVLGGDFAEYRPTGGCRVVMLGSIILGRVLEVARSVSPSVIATTRAVYVAACANEANRSPRMSAAPPTASRA